MELGPGPLPGFKCWRTAVNSLCEKLSEIFTASGDVALQRSDTSWETSRDDLRSTASYFPFLTSWDAIALAITGQWRGECRNLLVRLLKILHAFRPECEKSMLRTASDHRSLRFLGSLAISSIHLKLGKQSCSSQTWVISLRRLQKGFTEEFTLCITTQNIVVSIPAWDSLFGCFVDDVTEVVVSSTSSESGGNKVFAHLFVKAM